MGREETTDQFHNNELGDVYDLYNACNGVMFGELLDVRRLDELSEDEREVLDVPRLREIWLHTASGCAKCRHIVATLNLSRRMRVTVSA